MNILEQIMAERKDAVKEAKERISSATLEKQAAGRIHHSLTKKFADKSRHCIIAEMKKASPSAGLLRPDYDPAELARTYARAGASAISVLTEPRHFLGSETDLRLARQAVDLPILRKDFMCDSYQVLEAAAWGADIILLIVAALDKALLKDLYAQAIELHLDVLAEAHTEEELRTAFDLEKAILGVNSRNLKTLKTDLDIARRLVRIIPPGRFSVAESGIRSKADIEDLSCSGYQGFLIGESILKSDNPDKFLAKLVLASGQ